MPNYVAQYQRLDERASSAESKVEEYRQRAEENRWEQCRIAYEAIEEAGEYSRTSFAKAVGKNPRHIGRQVEMWAGYGDVGASARPSYGDALLEAEGRTRETRDTNRLRSHLRHLPPAGKMDLARQLMDDPEVGDDVVELAEDEGIERRGRRASLRPPSPDPDQVAEKVRRNMGRALGHDTDQATDYLLGAANDIAHAIFCKETWGIDYPDAEQVALAKIDRYLAAYRSGTTAKLTKDDREWAESIGVEL